MDLNRDEVVSLSELLRLVQLFNFASYGCSADTEDKYAPSSPDYDCTPHSSDYAPQDWMIKLNELLRAVQFYNANGYYLCTESDDADSYCVGKRIL